MKNNSKKDKPISRRSTIQILVGSLLIPLFGFGKSDEAQTPISNDNEYQTLLKSDGTAVKVKISTLNKSKIIKKNISNKSLLNWLGRKL